MSWASLANNQTVSFNNLQNAVNTYVFVAKTAIPVSTEQITKADADTYVYIDTAFGPYAAKASNQLVVKSNLQPSLFPLGLSEERDIAGDTCFVPFTIIQTVTYSGTLGVGTVVNGATIFGNTGYFLILTGGDTYSTIGINDNGVVFYLEFICPL